MAKTKKTKKNPALSILLAVCCVAMIVFLAFTVKGNLDQKSDLISDPIFLDAMCDYFGKAPAQITQEDLNTIRYIGFADDTTLQIGGQDVLTALQSEDETTASSASPASVSLPNDLTDFAGDLKLLGGLKYLDLSGYPEVAKSAEELANAKTVETLASSVTRR